VAQIIDYTEVIRMPALRRFVMESRPVNGSYAEARKRLEGVYEIGSSQNALRIVRESTETSSRFTVLRISISSPASPESARTSGAQPVAYRCPELLASCRVPVAE